MGAYMKKITSKTVTLANGELANVSVFGYKPYGWDHAANARMHFRSGCGTCDRMADEGKRTGWVVEGHKGKDGTITVNPRGYKLPRLMGSYMDGWFDTLVHPMREGMAPAEMSEVVTVGKGMVIDAEQAAINAGLDTSPSFAELAKEGTKT